jgi:hypothetical protein
MLGSFFLETSHYIRSERLPGCYAMRKLKLTKWKQRGYTKEHCGLEKHQTYE